MVGVKRIESGVRGRGAANQLLPERKEHELKLSAPLPVTTSNVTFEENMKYQLRNDGDTE